MAVPSKKDLITPEYIEAKKVLSQYRCTKLLLDLVRRPDLQKLIEEASEYSPILKKTAIRKISRI